MCLLQASAERVSRGAVATTPDISFEMLIAWKLPEACLGAKSPRRLRAGRHIVNTPLPSKKKRLLWRAHLDQVEVAIAEHIGGTWIVSDDER
jgi:hypothetical protein